MKYYTYSHYEKRYSTIKNPNWRWWKPWINPTITHTYWHLFERTFSAVDDNDAIMCYEQFKRIYLQDSTTNGELCPQMIPGRLETKYAPDGNFVEEGVTNLITNSDSKIIEL